MAEDHAMRASDADRERIAAALRDHASAGRLSLDELSERLGEVYEARTIGQLQGPGSPMRELPPLFPPLSAPRSSGSGPASGRPQPGPEWGHPGRPPGEGWNSAMNLGYRRPGPVTPAVPASPSRWTGVMSHPFLVALIVIGVFSVVVHGAFLWPLFFITMFLGRLVRPGHSRNHRHRPPWNI